MQARSRLNNDEAKRQDDCRKSYVGRVNNEDTKRSAVETDVQQLERVEMELISKLQKTQAVQKDAYTQLEKVLKVPGSPGAKTRMNQSFQNHEQSRLEANSTPVPAAPKAEAKEVTK